VGRRARYHRQPSAGRLDEFCATVGDARDRIDAAAVLRENPTNTEPVVELTVYPAAGGRTALTEIGPVEMRRGTPLRTD
jgi:hypothetical protein